MPLNMKSTDRFTGVTTVTTSTNDEWTFQYWLKNHIEVAAVFELATGVSFPRRGKLWLGLHQQLIDIKEQMLSSGDRETLGWHANKWLVERTKR